MATPGANIKYNGSRRAWTIAQRLKLKISGAWGNLFSNRSKAAIADGTATTRVGHLGWKAGVPADNTAADAPTGLNDVIIDTDTGIPYRCTTYVSGSSFAYTALAS